MRDSELQKMFDVEDSHFWFRAVRKIVLGLTSDLATQALDVLDLGCGTGGTMSQMPKAWRVFGADHASAALTFCQRRGHTRLARVDAQRLPLRDASFDVVFALDVIEHTEHDERTASEVLRVLRPGGRLVASVPAYQTLFGPHDEALGHFRRYRRSTMRRLLEEAGFDILKLTYFNSLLFPLAAATRLARRVLRWGSTSDAGTAWGPLNDAFYAVFLRERRLLEHVDFPVGLSVLAVARRPS